jgi:dienelactone hydrolase
MLGGKSALLGVLLFLCSCIVHPAAIAHDDDVYTRPDVIEEQVRIPVPAGQYSIAATILRPTGPGPFGVVVLNHGVPVSEEQRLTTSAEDFRDAAPVFVRLGYVVVMPLRRGFGATGGDFAEDAGSCSDPDFEHGERAAADDVMAAYDYAQQLPYVDPDRMILAGQSAGGMVSIYTAGMRHPRGLIAVLSFAGGRGGNPAVDPGMPCAVEPLADVFDEAGRSMKAPVLFNYAENDHYFGPKVTHYWFDRFTAAGARAEYVLQPAFGSDGHYLFVDPDGIREWLPAVERFFSENHVPYQPFGKTMPGGKTLVAGVASAQR